MGRKIKPIREKIDKKEKKLLVRRMHRFLNKREWEIKLGWANNDLGSCNPSHDTIYLNIYRDMVKTFVHEYLHAVYPNMNHKEVERLESKIYNRLTNREIKNLAKKIMLGRKITLRDFDKIPDD